MYRLRKTIHISFVIIFYYVTLVNYEFTVYVRRQHILQKVALQCAAIFNSDLFNSCLNLSMYVT